MAVQDPFEVKRNVANTLRIEKERPLLEEFRRAARLTRYSMSAMSQAEAAASETGACGGGGGGVLALLLSRA
jgi:hypothetical protein